MAAVLKALYELWKYGKTISKGAVARVASFLADHNLRLFAVFFFTFINFFSNFWAAVTKLEGNKIFLAVESLGVTLGGSLNQILNGLTLMVTPNIGVIKWLTGVLTLVLGLSTIYIWFKGNGLIVRFVESTNPTAVHRAYMLAILVLSVIAYHDATIFYELYDVSTELGMDVSNQTETAGQVAEGVKETGYNATVEAKDTTEKLNFLSGLLE